jgi:peptide/nickel transport system substrate-binding protein
LVSRVIRPVRVALALLALTALTGSTCRPPEAAPAQGPPATPPAAEYLNEVTTTGVPQMGGILVYGVPAETSSFNPLLSTWASYSLTIARSIFDTLTTYDDAGRIQMLVAESMEPGEDHRSWTVKLRPGIFFSNGKPVTAQAVVESQQAFKASGVLGELMARVDSWEVQDTLTFVVHANQPWAAFPHAMSTQIGIVTDPEWLHGPDSTHPIGVGAFTVERWDVNREIVLKRNPNYWRRDSRGSPYPYLDGVTFRVIEDEAARSDALRKGEIDVMMQTYATPSVAELLDEARRGRFQAFTDERFETPEDHIVVNTAKPPLNDLDARRALAHAIDPYDYLARITGGLDAPANSPWAPGSPWYVDVRYPTYDPIEARRLVDVVKSRNGGRFAVTLLGSPSPESVRVTEYLKHRWQGAGVEVALDGERQQTKLISLVQGNYDLAHTQQFDNVHPSNELLYWQDWGKPLGELSLNFARLADPDVTRLAIEAAGSTGDAERERYHALSHRFAELVPFIWLGHATRSVVAQPRVVDLVRAPLPGGGSMIEFIQGSHPTFQIWLRR